MLYNLNRECAGLGLALEKPKLKPNEWRTENENVYIKESEYILFLFHQRNDVLNIS